MYNYYIEDPSIENIIACTKAYMQKEAVHIRYLYNYYNGKHKILTREAPEGRPCNNVVTNFCRSITDDTIGFVKFKDAVTVFNKAEIESIFKDTLMVGIGYGLLEYVNSELTCKRIKPTRALVIKDTTLAHNPVAGVVYNEYDVYERGFSAKKVELFIYDSVYVYHYKGEALDTVTFDYKKEHFIGMIPLLEATSSLKYEGLYDQVIPLQDSYNFIDSSYTDGRETFSESFLLIQGMGITPENADSLISAESKIINLPVEGADAKYLTKEDHATEVIAMLDNIADRVHKVSLVPDFDKEGHYGYSSGKSNSFRMIAFINMVSSRENMFKEKFLDFFNPEFIFADLPGDVNEVEEE